MLHVPPKANSYRIIYLGNVSVLLKITAGLNHVANTPRQYYLPSMISFQCICIRAEIVLVSFSFQRLRLLTITKHGVISAASRENKFGTRVQQRLTSVSTDRWKHGVFTFQCNISEWLDLTAEKNNLV